MITLTPLTPCSGISKSSDEAARGQGPISYLLELDGVKILLDMGGFDPRQALEGSYGYEERIRELSPSISLVLLSHSPSSYLSLYPYARAHWGLKCPVYATQPTVEMGRVVCLEETLQWRSEFPVDDSNPTDSVKSNEDGLFVEESAVDEKSVVETTPPQPLKGPFLSTSDEINEAFNWIKSVRYSQPVHLSGILSDLLLTPYASGHTLGGSIFKIRSPMSGTVLYAVGLNHAPERHLDATVLLSTGGAMEGLQRPDLLIAEAGRSCIKIPKQKDRAQELLKLITTTLQSGNSLLFPVDASPRLLELLILLDQHWSYSISQSSSSRSPWNFPLCLVSRTGQEMVSFAKLLMEWVGGSVMQDNSSGTGQGRNRRRRGGGDEEKGPFAFKHLRIFASVQELAAAIPVNQPKLVMAVPLSMEYGPSRRMFTYMASRPGNLVVLTNGAPESTLAQSLMSEWESAQNEDARYGKGSVGTPEALSYTRSITLNAKVPLQGEELEAYLTQEREAKERAAAHKTAQDRSRRMLEADELDSDTDSEADTVVDGGDDATAEEEDGAPAAGNAFMESDDIRATSFDIYVKGQQMKTTSFFRSALNSSQQARFRMFPHVERKGRKVDVYGETLDIGAWIRKGREIEEETESEEVREAKRRKKEEEEKKKEPPEPPSKYISEDISVQVQCRVMFIDMEGLHDGRAIKTIIPRLNPRKAILVRSSISASEDLIHSLSAVQSLTKDIHSPVADETVTIGETTQSYSISLSEELLSRVQHRWSKFEDFDVAKVAGTINFPANASTPVLDIPSPAPAGEIKPETMTTTPAVGGLASLTAGALPRSMLIGDLRLIALKQALMERSIPAEFAGEGVLICGSGIEAMVKGEPGSNLDNVVAVRKTGEGTIELEGSVGRTYYLVRDVMYKALAHVLL